MSVNVNVYDSERQMPCRDTDMGTFLSLPLGLDDTFLGFAPEGDTVHLMCLAQ